MLSMSTVALIRKLSAAFAEHKIPYAVGGAHSLNVWADPRGTSNIAINVFVTVSGEDETEHIDDTFVDAHFLPPDLSYATVYINGVKVFMIIKITCSSMLTISSGGIVPEHVETPRANCNR